MFEKHKHCDHALFVKEVIPFHGRFGYSRHTGDNTFEVLYECCRCGRQDFCTLDLPPNSVYGREFEETKDPNTGGRIWSRKLKPT